MRRRHKLIVAAVIVAASAGFLLWNASADAGPPALSVSDAKYQASQLGGREVAVRGTVLEGSILESGGRLLRFTVGDRLEQLDVDYNGTAPDGFGAKEVIVRGSLVPTDAGWSFRASAIQVGCASKY